MVALSLDWILSERVDERHRSVPHLTEVSVGGLGDAGLDLWSLQLPAALLRGDAVAQNIELLADYCRTNGIDLAPHGKTTMAPQIIQQQLDAGAWAITAATMSQVRLFRRAGVQRIILANQLVEAASIAWLSSALDDDPGFDFFCLLDSNAALDILSGTLRGLRPERPVKVLVELGHDGGRTGCRTSEAALALAERVASHGVLRFAGFEAYEGTVTQGADPDALAAVDHFLERLELLAREAVARGLAPVDEPLIVSAGGSAYIDRVVAMLAGLLPQGVRIVLRSGCYVAHDVGKYHRLSPFDSRSSGGPLLRNAIEVWASVLSRPEPDLILLGCGRRDVSYDVELPKPLFVSRGGTLPDTVPEGWEVFRLADQHTFIRVDPTDDIAVGDLVGLGISHPCTTFDRWSLLAVIDGSYRVTGGVRTYF